VRGQTALEEKLNSWSHGIGALLGLIGLILLVVYFPKNSSYSLLSVIVYGISIIILFSASALYHSVAEGKKKRFYRKLDHISIYLLIAGTYTPVTLITLAQSKGWLLFCLVWSIAAFGLILKIFFTGKFEAFSLILYLVMGWLIVLDYSNLSQLLPEQGLNLLFAGGAFYTLGVVFYAIEKIPYNHVIWHLCVLGGAICHFFMIFNYVI